LNEQPFGTPTVGFDVVQQNGFDFGDFHVFLDSCIFRGMFAFSSVVIACFAHPGGGLKGSWVPLYFTTHHR